mgnify:CR=1 FL=1
MIALPELFSPFPSRINPHADVVHEGTVEWLRGFGTFKEEVDYRKFHATRIGRLAARFHPDASLEALQLVSDWYGWMFIRDDQRDESDLGERPDLLAATNARFLEIMEGFKPAPEEVSLAHALWDLRQRVLAEAPAAAWVAQLIASIGEHFESTVWEATNRSRGVTPDMDSYIRMRPVTGGLNVDTQFIEIAERTHLPLEVRYHPVLQTLTRTSNNAVCWANDIFSLQKEMKRDVHNLVLVLQHAEGLTLQEAVNRAAEMHNAEVRTFTDSVSQLQSLGDHQTDVNLKRFVGVLHTRMRGFVDWANESGRYQPLVSVSPPTTGD